MAEIRFEGKGRMLWNSDFLSQFLNPALDKLSDIQLYQKSRGYFGGDDIAIKLKAEKTNMPIARLDMKALLEQLTNEASKIVRIDGNFYNLQEKLDGGDGKWIIAQNYNPIFRVDFSSTADFQWAKMANYNKDTTLEHNLDHMDSHKGDPCHVTMKFEGQDKFIGKIYETLLDFYKRDRKTKILV